MRTLQAEWSSRSIGSAQGGFGNDGRPMGAAEVVETFQLVVDRHKLATNVVGVFEAIQVEQDGFDLGLAVNQ
jgi:hypothetical protein